MPYISFFNLKPLPTYAHVSSIITFNYTVEQSDAETAIAFLLAVTVRNSAIETDLLGYF